MGELVRYSREGSIATITMDDGKVNVLSPAMQTEINGALDQAEADAVPVVLAGRPGRFSGGFDLATLNAGGPDATGMLFGGFELSYRMLSFPTPIVIACTGHAIAMASFLLLSGDYRVGIEGTAHKIQANEVAIGMTMPYTAIEICRQRLTRSHFHRAIALAEPYNHETAIAAGFLDAVAPEGDLLRDACAIAEGYASTLNPAAHTFSKLRAREQALAAIRAAIEADAQNLGISR